MSDNPNMSLSALIIEDSEEFSLLLKKHLKDLNVFKNVIISGDGKDAQLKIKLEAFDFYFIDENLPGSNGLEIIKEIFEAHPEHMVRVVYSSGSMEKPNAMEALKMGVVNFLVKPITKGQIQEKVKGILRKRKS